MTGLAVTVEFLAPVTQAWVVLAEGSTDLDGRLCSLQKEFALEEGLYRLRFDTSGVSPFFPEVSIQFRVGGAAQHYHVPLLLSPYGYSTYRGS